METVCGGQSANLYSKQDAIMTKGMAILCMVVLHLF